MPRPIREEQRQQMTHDIKRSARELMKDKGSAGLSLRAIARDLGITAPAIYNYFPKLDDLITALIIDAFQDLIRFMESASQPAESPSMTANFKAALLAFRRWALLNPIQFQLLYGNPIPGYERPLQETQQIAQQPHRLLVELFETAMQNGELVINPEIKIPPEIDQHLQLIAAYSPFEQNLDLKIIYMLIVAWTRIQGVLMLEMYQHLTVIVGNPEVFFEAQVDQIMREIGFQF
ncbi:TetR/AcrR family transcriptional regulator [Anaerolineales bacterium]